MLHVASWRLGDGNLAQVGSALAITIGFLPSGVVGIELATGHESGSPCEGETSRNLVTLWLSNGYAAAPAARVGARCPRKRLPTRASAAAVETGVARALARHRVRTTKATGPRPGRLRGRGGVLRSRVSEPPMARAQVHARGVPQRRGALRVSAA